MVRSFKEFQKEFGEPYYSRRQMAEALERCSKEHVVNRVIKRGKDFNIAMRILAIYKTLDGIIVEVD